MTIPQMLRPVSRNPFRRDPSMPARNGAQHDKAAGVARDLAGLYPRAPALNYLELLLMAMIATTFYSEDARAT